MSSETAREGVDESLLGRGVNDGESNLLKSSGEIDRQSAVKKVSDLISIVSKGSATPGTEDQGVMGMGLSDAENLVDPCPEYLR